MSVPEETRGDVRYLEGKFDALEKHLSGMIKVTVLEMRNELLESIDRRVSSGLRYNKIYSALGGILGGILAFFAAFLVRKP